MKTIISVTSLEKDLQFEKSLNCWELGLDIVSHSLKDQAS